MVLEYLLLIAGLCKCKVNQALPFGVHIPHTFRLAGQEITLAYGGVGLACCMGLLDALALAGDRAPFLEAISGSVVDTVFGVDFKVIFVVELPPIGQ